MDFTTETREKELVFLEKVGPAFSVGEVERAHQLLTNAKVPTELHGFPCSLEVRICYLLGRLNIAEKFAYRYLHGTEMPE